MDLFQGPLDALRCPVFRENSGQRRGGSLGNQKKPKQHGNITRVMGVCMEHLGVDDIAIYKESMWRGIVFL
jgi:hypothetical protein